MKLAAVLLCLVVVVYAEIDYDKIDIDKILSNERVLSSYIKCMLDQGPCTPTGRDFKEKAPLAISSACGVCTESQKALVRKGSLFVMKNRPKDWDLLVQKFDPDSEFREGFLKFLNEKSKSSE